MTSSQPQPVPNAPRAAAADTTLEPFLPSDPKELEIDHTDDLVFLRPYVSDQTYEFIRHNSGLVLVGASQFFFACMAATVKYFLSISDISVPTLIAVRMGITAVFSAVILLIQRDPYPFLGPPEHRKLLFVRGAVGFLGLSSNYLSLKRLSVSDSAAIGFLIPAATAVLGVLVLKEKMTRREVIAGGLCLCGVMLVARPPALFGSWAAGPDPGLEKPKSSRAVAVFWAFMSVVGASFAYITIRRLGDKVHALHSMLWFSYMCVAVSSMAILFTPGPTAWVDNLGDFVLIMAIGVFGFMGQMLLTLGLQRERVGRAGIAVYLNVFFAIILELLIFHTLPSFLSLIGIGVILTSAYWVASASNKAAPREDLESQPISRSPSPLPANSPSIQGELYDYSATTPESENGPREASMETIRQLDDGRLKPKRPSSKVRRRSSASTISVNGTRGQ